MRNVFGSGELSASSINQLDEASTLLDEALRIVERTGERSFSPEIHRPRAELIQQRNALEARCKQSFTTF